MNREITNFEKFARAFLSLALIIAAYLHFSDKNPSSNKGDGTLKGIVDKDNVVEVIRP